MFDDIPENLPTGTPPAPSDNGTEPASKPSNKQKEAPIVDEGKELHSSPDGTLNMPEPSEPAPAPAQAASPVPPVEDMFAEVDGGAPVVPTPPVPEAPGQAPAKRPSSGGGKGKVIAIVIAVIVALGVLAAVGVFAYNFFSAVQEMDQANSAQETPSETPTTTTPTPTTTEPEPTPEPEPQVELDSDNDGLTDAQEAQYGTSIRKPDTDNDGLFDREEVMVYKTDPNNADTDADGFLDGSEVQNGYNPNGPGRLTDPQK